MTVKINLQLSMYVDGSVNNVTTTVNVFGEQCYSVKTEHD
jgi:hypothetical protein